MPMAQIARQDEDTIDGAFAAGQPALQHHRSHGVAKVVQARWTALEGNPYSQPTERSLNGAGSQTITSLRDEEVPGPAETAFVGAGRKLARGQSQSDAREPGGFSRTYFLECSVKCASNLRRPGADALLRKSLALRKPTNRSRSARCGAKVGPPIFLPDATTVAPARSYRGAGKDDGGPDRIGTAEEPGCVVR